MAAFSLAGFLWDRPGGADRITIFSLAGLLAAWVAFLHLDWEVYPEYSYGWLVPLIAVYLFHRRWPDRPRAAAQWPAPAYPIVGLWILVWPMVWMFREANPDWRLLGWVATGATTGAMLSVLWLRGGKTWALHFFFPAALLFLAVPWPSGLEQQLIQGLTRAVTATTVEGLAWCGVYAEQKGNIILLSAGTLGVDEACSGVRSFQSNLMAALVVGELFRLGWARRGMLLAAGLVLGFLLNLCRSMFLAWNASQGGIQTLQSLHDPAGYTILLVSFAILLGLARLLMRGQEPVVSPADAPPTETVSPRMGWIFSALLAWLILTPVASELWYRAHELPAEEQTRWTLKTPAGPLTRERPIPDAVRNILRFDEGRAFQWSPAAGSSWLVYELAWPPGRTGASLARSHTPEVCLPASGSILLERGASRLVRVNQVPFELRDYTFQSGERKLHVFFALWEQQPPAAASAPDLDYYEHRQRILSVREGRRNRGQKVIHATLAGYRDLDAARQAFLDFMHGHVVAEARDLPSTP